MGCEERACLSGDPAREWPGRKARRRPALSQALCEVVRRDMAWPVYSTQRERKIRDGKRGGCGGMPAEGGMVYFALGLLLFPPHSYPAAIFIDQLDPRHLKGLLNLPGVSGVGANKPLAGFHSFHG
jgi:hypothetical protein